MAGALAAEGLPCPAAPQKADCVHAQTQTEAAAEDRDPAQPGGGVPQRPGAGNHGPPPPILRDHLRVADCETYREQAFRHGIPFRPRGLFPPADPLLARLAADPRLRPFEKRMSGLEGPSEALPRGGWATGDAAAAAGLDLRLFFQEPGAGEELGALRGAVRFGDGAAIGNGFFTTAHGGAIETALDEATAELAKCVFSPLVSTRDISFALLKPVPLHASLAVRARVKEVRGIRCYVEGEIRALGDDSGSGNGGSGGGGGADGEEGGVAVLATCTALLINIREFIL